jgi:hypothetical protein
MFRTIVASSLFLFLAAGCATVEGGYRYEYDGRVLRADGKTPVKSASIRVARPDAPPPPELPLKFAKAAPKYADHSDKAKTDRDGRFVGALTTVKGWKYTEFSGLHTSGPTKPPEPPVLDEVIVYVIEKGNAWTGYRMRVPAEAQKDAYSGVRKMHLPDLLLPDKPATTQATTQSTTAPTVPAAP